MDPMVAMLRAIRTELGRIDPITRPTRTERVALVAMSIDRTPVIRVRVTNSGVMDDPGSRFLLWSVSKVALAAAAFRLHDLGRLALDDPVRSILPGAPLHDRATVIQLLDHTAGLADYGGWPDYHAAVAAHPDRPWPLDRYLDRVAASGPPDDPGLAWRYSNIGYLLVRRIVEGVSGLSLDRALHELVLAPLAISDLGVSLRPDDRSAVTFPPRDPAATARYHPGWVTHGVLVGSAAATVALLDGVLGDGFLSDESRRRMSTATAPVADATVYGDLAWAPGVFVGTGRPAGRITGHSGGGPGSTTAALRSVIPDGRPATVAVAVDDEGDQAAGRLAMAALSALHRRETGD